MATKSSPATTSLRTDVLAVVCSVGCAIHCAATPILLAVLPSATGLRWLANPLFHQIVAIVCAILVLRAIVPGWVKHRSQSVASLAAIGLSLLVLSAFVLPDGCCLTQSAANGAAQSVSTIETASVFDLNPPLLTQTQLLSLFGTGITSTILEIQPMLTPIGGVFLILAHVINIGLTTGLGRSSRCSKSGCLH